MSWPSARARGQSGERAALALRVPQRDSVRDELAGTAHLEAARLLLSHPVFSPCERRTLAAEFEVADRPESRSAPRQRSERAQSAAASAAAAAAACN